MEIRANGLAYQEKRPENIPHQPINNIRNHGSDLVPNQSKISYDTHGNNNDTIHIIIRILTDVLFDKFINLKLEIYFLQILLFFPQNSIFFLHDFTKTKNCYSP